MPDIFPMYVFEAVLNWIAFIIGGLYILFSLTGRVAIAARLVFSAVLLFVAFAFASVFISYAANWEQKFTMHGMHRVPRIIGAYCKFLLCCLVAFAVPFLLNRKGDAKTSSSHD